MRPRSLLAPLTLVALLAAPAAEAKPTPVAHAKESAPLFDGPKGKVIGSVKPGAPMEVLERTGARAKVVLNVWSRDYSPLNLVADPASMTAVASLVRVPDGARTVHEEKVDRYDARWERVSVTAWIPKSALVDDVGKVWAAALALQQERCTVCHGFKPADLMNASQWRGTLVIMAHRATLTPEEHALLSAFLQANAKPTEAK